MISTAIKNRSTIKFCVRDRNFGYQSKKYKVVFNFMEESILQLKIAFKDHIKIFEIFSPCLSIGHKNFKTDQLHFVFGKNDLVKGKMIFIVDCGQKVPEFRIFQQKELFLKELIFFIDHDTQNYINHYLESLPIQKLVISNDIYPLAQKPCP